jgi:hypothetical protein
LTDLHSRLFSCHPGPRDTVHHDQSCMNEEREILVLSHPTIYEERQQGSTSIQCPSSRNDESTKRETVGPHQYPSSRIKDQGIYEKRARAVGIESLKIQDSKDLPRYEDRRQCTTNINHVCTNLRRIVKIPIYSMIYLHTYLHKVDTCHPAYLLPTYIPASPCTYQPVST